MAGRTEEGQRGQEMTIGWRRVVLREDREGRWWSDQMALRSSVGGAARTYFHQRGGCGWLEGRRRGRRVREMLLQLRGLRRLLRWLIGASFDDDGSVGGEGKGDVAGGRGKLEGNRWHTRGLLYERGRRRSPQETRRGCGGRRVRRHDGRREVDGGLDGGSRCRPNGRGRRGRGGCGLVVHGGGRKGPRPRKRLLLLMGSESGER